MRTCELITSLILIIAFVAIVEAGTKKTTPKASQEPIDKMLAEIRKGDPKGVIGPPGAMGGFFTVRRGIDAHSETGRNHY